MGNGNLKSIGLISAILLCFVFSGCPRQPEKPAGKSGVASLAAAELPAFQDDLDRHSLRKAIERSLIFYDRIPPDRVFPLGEQRFRAEHLKASLVHFLGLLEADRLDRETLARDFDVYRLHDGQAPRTKDLLLLTGYYEPILEGRLRPDGEFRYPLYRLPPDLLTVDMAEFDASRFGNERVVGRLEGNRIVPYYTRAQIDVEGVLSHYGCELLWLRDPVKRFFLHVQGSGVIRLEDGRLVRVGYAGKNGRPYRSIGRYLIETGVVPREKMSLGAIESYLEENPRLIDEVLSHNESYVFFREVQQGPVGSIAVMLTPGRSIATDPEWYPRGGLAFLESSKPVIGPDGEVEKWVPMNRWVLNQDAGGAIKGPGRADLFAGSGRKAEAFAGRLKQRGSLYFLVKKSL